MEEVLLAKLLENGYEFIKEIGRGTVGVTYHCRWLGEEEGLGIDIAIKIISLKQAKDWKVIELFEREAKILANLHHHHIPRYFNYFTIETANDLYFCLVQELVDGKSLDRWYESGWQPDEQEMLDLSKQMLSILQYLYSLNPPVVHRDIKPQNIIYQREEKNLFLVDFGAVTEVYRNTFSHGLTFVGTMGFMAPEQYTGQVSFASDLYSWGATLVYLITGMNPADIPHKRMKLDWRKVAQIPVSEKFGQSLDILLEPIPERRPPSPQDALDMLIGKKAVPTPTTAVPPKSLTKLYKTTVSLKSQPPRLENIEFFVEKTDKVFQVTVKTTVSRIYYIPPPNFYKPTLVISAIPAIGFAYLLANTFLRDPLVLVLGLLLLTSLMYCSVAVLVATFFNFLFFGLRDKKQIEILKVYLDAKELTYKCRKYDKLFGQTLFAQQWRETRLTAPRITRLFACNKTQKKQLNCGLRVYYGTHVLDLFEPSASIPPELAEWLAGEISHFLGLDEE